MNTTPNQKISQLLDNDLNRDDALELLRKLSSDAELRATLGRYAAIGHVLKSREFCMAQPDFARSVAARLQHEPAYLVAKPRSLITRNDKLLALAASVAVVAVLAASGTSKDQASVSMHRPAALQLVQHRRVPADRQLVAQSAPQNGPQHPLNKRISEYLQAHNSSVYAETGAHYAPLASVTTYPQK